MWPGCWSRPARSQRREKKAAIRRPPWTKPARRINRGLVYNLFVTFGYFYLLGYWVNHLTGRRIIGTAPAFRTEERPRRARVIGTLRTGAVGLALVLVVGLLVHVS